VSRVKEGFVEMSSMRIAKVLPEPVMCLLYTLSSTPPYVAVPYTEDVSPKIKTDSPVLLISIAEG